MCGGGPVSTCLELAQWFSKVTIAGCYKALLLKDEIVNKIDSLNIFLGAVVPLVISSQLFRFGLAKSPMASNTNVAPHQKKI